MALEDLLDGRGQLDPTAARLLDPASTTTQLRGRCHAGSLYSVFQAVLIAGFVALAGCASKVGWSPSEERICSPKDPAQVCSLSAPDYGHVIELGDTKLLPGECVVLADAGRGGLLRIETRDPRGQRARRWIRAPKSKVTIVELREDGEPKLDERRSCDRAPFDLDR